MKKTALKPLKVHCSGAYLRDLERFYQCGYAGGIYIGDGRHVNGD
jgi:hypothetical protein